MMMYRMYPGYHHKKGSGVVLADNKHSLKTGILTGKGRRG